ncbi:hypothetical protein F1880_004689 [Penicillium rolfsii]|nr:hypothetical protein F1880_004689 [Penicillium rolfsii]
MIQARELEALQARIREAEERLKAQSYYTSSAPQRKCSEQERTTGKDSPLRYYSDRISPVGGDGFVLGR